MDADGSRATVLVANTDAAVCEVVARIVEAAGHEAVRLTEADQIASAVVTAAADAVVLDLGAESLAVLTELRSHHEPVVKAVRVVVLGTGPANARLAWQADADAVLVRPFAATGLQAELASSLERNEAERRSLRIARSAALAS